MMKGAVGFPIGASLLECNIFADDLNNVEAIFDSLGVGHGVY